MVDKNSDTATQIKELQQEIERLKQEKSSSEWGLQKTNQAVKILYKDLEKKNRELKKLDDLKSKFVSTVSHELRTPLAITMEGISLVVDGIPGEINDKQKKILTTAKDNIDRLTQLINDLLDISKIEAGKLDVKLGFVDVAALIHKLVESYQSVVSPKKIKLTTNVSSSEVFIFIDKGMIIQVLNNLLNNAIKFTGENGQIEVTLKEEDAGVVISVQDTGIGIGKEDMSKLFQKFQQFDRIEGAGTKGTGLGLSISKALVEIHNGNIWAESEIGKGTTFFFTLPSYEKTKSNFDNEFDEILEMAKSEERCVAFILVRINEFSENIDEDKEKIRTLIMNKMNSVFKQIVTGPQDKFLHYDRNSVYMIFPDTNKAEGVIIVNKLKEAFIHIQSDLNEDKYKIDLNLGLSIYPFEAESRKGLIKIAQEYIDRKKRILVVDDHPQIIHFLQTRLEHSNYNVKSAVNGEEAMTCVEQYNPDLIILDIMMPKMDGYGVLGKLKEKPETSSIPIIILTAKEVGEIKKGSMGLGAMPIVSKTDGFDKVARLIGDLL